MMPWCALACIPLNVVPLPIHLLLFQSSRAQGCNLLSSCLQAFSGLAVCSRTGGGSATENEKTCSDDCFQTKHLQVEKELVRCLQAISVVALKIYKPSKPKWEGVP